MHEVFWFPGEEEERDGGRDGDDEDVVHPDVVGDGGEEDGEEEDGDGVEGGGEESPDYSLWQKWFTLSSITFGLLDCEQCQSMNPIQGDLTRTSDTGCATSTADSK